jgi:hypothetical protein
MSSSRAVPADLMMRVARVTEYIGRGDGRFYAEGEKP